MNTTDARARYDDIMQRHSATAVEAGRRLQGDHFLAALHDLDEVDEEWTEGWLRWVYDHLYVRGVLDDRTRALVVIGECTVLNHVNQLANHMRTALGAGATPAEIREVLLQSCVYAGMPGALNAIRVYRELMMELGLEDYTKAPDPTSL